MVTGAKRRGEFVLIYRTSHRGVGLTEYTQTATVHDTPSLPLRAERGSEEAAADEGEGQIGGGDLQRHAGMEPAHPAAVGHHVRPVCLYFSV